MANKIKNKFTFPKSTEFTPRDLVIDVKNGHLYYKSNFAVFKVQGTIFSTNIAGLTTNLSIGTAEDTEVLFNNASTIDGIGNFTITPSTDGSGNGTVNIGAVNIDGGSIDGTTIGANSSAGGTFGDLAANSVDLNGGNIDGTSIGLSTPAIAKFTAITVGNTSTQGQGFNITTRSNPAKELLLTTQGNFYSSNHVGGAIKLKVLNQGSQGSTPYVHIKGGLHVVANSQNPGNIKSDEDIIAYASDKRLKENIINIENPLQKIKQLRGVYFDWKDKTKDLGFNPTTKKNEIGMIAQEVEKVIPQAITTAPFDDLYEGKDREKYKTIKYDRIIPLLVECINEQQKQIDNLKNQMKQWQNQIMGPE